MKPKLSKKRVIKFFVKAALLGCLYILSVTTTQAERLTFTTGDWCPYIFELDGTVDPEKPGFSIEIVNSVFAIMGYDIKYVTAPFLRQIQEVERGTYSALAGVYSEEAPNLLFPDEPIGMTRNCFYSKISNNWRYNNSKDISAIKIAVVSGYTYGELDDYIEAYPKEVIKLTGNEAAMMDRLTELVDINRVTAFIQDARVAEYYFMVNGIEGRFKSSGCLEAIPSMLGFSPVDNRAENFIEAFDIQINKMRTSGELKKILTKYNVSDWK